MMKLLTVLGAIALVLLGVVFSVSYQDASANGASYLAAIGITEVPLLLRTAFAGTVYTVVLTVIFTSIVTSRLVTVKLNKKPLDLSFAHRSEELIYKMQEYLKYEGYGTSVSNADEILQECYSFNLTLQKAGFDLPHIPSATAAEMFEILLRFYRLVGPLLRDNHSDEARQSARSFSSAYPHPTGAKAR